MAVLDLPSLRSQVSLDAIRAARETIRPHLPRTPLLRHPLLCEATGLDLWLKHENHLPTGAFKVRGGVNLLANMPADQRARGLITATRGNHGQSIAFAARIFGARCTVVIPRGNNPEKNDAMQAHGAELVEHGADFDEARVFAEQRAAAEGLTHVHPANEPHLINGVAIYSLEIWEDLPEVDVLIVPIGAGSGVSGAITVFRALRPQVKIVGVQAAAAPSIHDSWRAGRIEPGQTKPTIADGLATRVPAELTFGIIRDAIDDIVLVSEDEIRGAIRLLFTTTHNLAEGAGAAAVAAAIQLAPSLKGRHVAAVLTGGNIDQQTLKSLL